MSVVTDKILSKKITEVFDFGFTEMHATSMLSDGNFFVANKKDFEKGGKFERFANYTVGRFEQEFVVTLKFC